MLKCPECYSENIIQKGTRNGKTRFKCKDCKSWTIAPINLDHIEEKEFDKKSVKKHSSNANKKSKIVITSAQNATPPHKAFLNNLIAYCKENDAELLVIPYRYKNPTSVFTDRDYDWWHTDVTPYIVNQRFKVNENLFVLGDIKTQPTQMNPLTSMENFTNHESIIVGHPKIALQSVATRQGQMAKLMLSTGTCTVPNYTNTKLGKRGERSHCFGAAVVEKDQDEIFHVRHIHATDDGSFYDVNKKYANQECHDIDGIEALVVGDLHQWWLDPNVDTATFTNEDSIYNTVKPKRTIVHDICDSYSISHHHGPFEQFTKTKFQKNSIKQELEDAFGYIESRTDNDLYIVPSNHDDHIRRWVEDANWKNDPVNAEFYLETALHMVQTAHMTEGGGKVADPFQYWGSKYLTSDRSRILDEDESLQVKGVELSLHGDRGCNGSRGHPNGLSKIGTRAIVGHYHSPIWKDGLIAVGTSTVLNMAYAKGPSSWIQSHVLLYPNGRFTHVHIIKGRYCASQIK